MFYWTWYSNSDEYFIDSDKGKLRVYKFKNKWYSESQKKNSNRWHIRNSIGFYNPDEAKKFTEKWAIKNNWKLIKKIENQNTESYENTNRYSM